MVKTLDNYPSRHPFPSLIHPPPSTLEKNESFKSPKRILLCYIIGLQVICRLVAILIVFFFLK